VIGVLTIVKFIGYIHEFRHFFWPDAIHLLDEFRTTEPSIESVDCLLVGDILG
jgi:hypothetical protein